MDADRLRSSPLFEGLSDEALERCSQLFQEAEILKGSSLAKEGDFAYKFFLVLDGEVDVLHDFEVIARLGPGDFVGEVGVAAGGRRNARVTANTRCDVAWMMAWDFQTMTEEFPEVAARIEAAIADRSETPATQND